MRCEHDLPVRPGEPFTFDQCRVCWRIAGGDASRPVAPAPPPPPPCEFRDDCAPVPPPPGAPVNRTYLRCPRLAEVVCLCVCNPQCPRYVPWEPTDV